MKFHSRHGLLYLTNKEGKKGVPRGYLISTPYGCYGIRECLSIFSIKREGFRLTNMRERLSCGMTHGSFSSSYTISVFICVIHFEEEIIHVFLRVHEVYKGQKQKQKAKYQVLIKTQGDMMSLVLLTYLPPYVSRLWECGCGKVNCVLRKSVRPHKRM